MKVFFSINGNQNSVSSVFCVQAYSIGVPIFTKTTDISENILINAYSAEMT